ncbi:MAG TPA: BrnT family toxin [Verrucomicrobiales bacterium]|nr:BrnT family toxin [Verrucomicrobiales bacterium]
MEFDWLDATFDLKAIMPREIEESFEDPFGVKLLPDGSYGESESRYVSLGKTLRNRPVFSIFWTDGKRYRVIFAREMTAGELAFYERWNASQE